MISEMDFSIDSGMLRNVLVSVVIFLIIYFVLLIRALVEMIRLDAPGVVIVFTYDIPDFVSLVIDTWNSKPDHLAFCPKGLDDKAGIRCLKNLLQ